MDGDARELLAGALDLPRVQARPDLDPEGGRRPDDLLRAADAAERAVEGRPSSGGVSAGVKRSEQPSPRLSVTTTRPRRVSSRRKRASAGWSQFSSTFERYPWW
ncbi:MAG TPA: hypothetical protein VD769_11060 [Gaiellaceae bacterium]|nr:hypothetical protein [Gaiellaceae bacterium]